jgi:hypothetical protein
MGGKCSTPAVDDNFTQNCFLKPEEERPHERPCCWLSHFFRGASASKANYACTEFSSVVRIPICVIIRTGLYTTG